MVLPMRKVAGYLVLGPKVPLCLDCNVEKEDVGFGPLTR